MSSFFADLHEGELIHGDNFNLFAAMSALEVLHILISSYWFLYLHNVLYSY